MNSRMNNARDLAIFRKQDAMQVVVSSAAGGVLTPPVAPERFSIPFFKPKGEDSRCDRIDQCIIALHEKRTATREGAMAALVGVLEQFVPAAKIDYRSTSIVTRCLWSIKRGNANEALHAYRVLGLLGLTLGGGGECAGSKEILDEAYPFIARTLQASSDTARLVAALQSLAAATFACADSEDDIEKAMQAIWGVVDPKSAPKLAAPAKKTAPQVLAAAVSSWAFLLTTVDVYQSAVQPDTWKETISQLAKLLLHDDRAVRMATGEALAVCIELDLTQHASPHDMEAVKETISDLAAEASGKGANKKLLAEQKDLFRKIDAFLEDGECAEKSVRTSSSRRAELRVSTWEKVVQIDYLRRYLGGGFLGHLHGNELLRDTFNVASDEEEADARMSKLTRRWREKAWSLELRKNRDIAWAMKNVFSLPEESHESSMPVEHGPTQLLLKYSLHSGICAVPDRRLSLCSA